jgi:hypothetical protein
MGLLFWQHRTGHVLGCIVVGGRSSFLRGATCSRAEVVSGIAGLGLMILGYLAARSDLQTLSLAYGYEGEDGVAAQACKPPVKGHELRYKSRVRRYTRYEDDAVEQLQPSDTAYVKLGSLGSNPPASCCLLWQAWAAHKLSSCSLAVIGPRRSRSALWILHLVRHQPRDASAVPSISN